MVFDIFSLFLRLMCAFFSLLINNIYVCVYPETTFLSLSCRSFGLLLLSDWHNRPWPSNTNSQHTHTHTSHPFLYSSRFSFLFLFFLWKKNKKSIRYRLIAPSPIVSGRQIWTFDIFFFFKFIYLKGRRKKKGHIKNICAMMEVAPFQERETGDCRVADCGRPLNLFLFFFSACAVLFFFFCNA